MFVPAATGDRHAVSSLGRALTLVHTRQATRRSELTDLLGLTRTATGSVLRELERLGLVRSDPRSGPASSGNQTGRPSHRLQIHPQAPIALAVQVQAETLLVARVLLGGTLQHVAEVPLSQRHDPEVVLVQAADRLAADLALVDRHCVGVGVAVPSAVADDGTALAAMTLSWPPEVPVRDALMRLLAARGHPSLPVQVGNDANLAALAEHRHGAGQGASDLLYLMTGQRGVGGALVIHGRLHTGSAGYALEVGHLTVQPGGRPCYCGNSGCLEVETDPAALLAAASRAPAEPALAAARAVIADPDAHAAVHAVTERLAIGIAGLVNILNPDRILLAGLHADLLAADQTHLQDTLAHRSFLEHAAHVDLRPSRLVHACLLGAGELAFQNLLDDPRQAPAVSRPSSANRPG